ncbi:hypothetical protein [uncultured Zobellia sp.]|uniref:hypothetical protein n=1 Tax=uncultured Zobellia sp. TaxID=255433 RepID=UPI002594376A|nr:hypothetical protein [uncultured Zobellia sp.]
MNTKKDIKNRMIKNAAIMWGVPVSEIETSFDPIVALLIAACASEIEKITYEVESSQARITEKVVQLMTPETMNGPSLAHAIMYAEPIDELTVLKPEYLFNYRIEQLYNKTAIKYKDIFFSPLQDFNVLNARVQFMAMGNTIIEVNEKKNEQNTVKQLKNSQLNSSTLYIGVSSNLDAIFLKDVLFYFEVMGVGNEELFYHHLRNTKWSFANEELEVVSGFETDKSNQMSYLNGIFENVSDKTNMVCQRIMSRYEKQFITVLGNSKKKTSQSKFTEVEISLQETDLKIAPSIKWLKIEFPRVVDNSILENIKCSLNAFPVVNRELKSFSYSIKEYINIMPIKTEDLFFDIKSIVNTDGEGYRAKNKDNTSDDRGTFILRNNNIAKLDKRKAREYVLHLIELLKDESASFSFLDNDFLRNNLKVLNQVIALLEKKVSEASSDLSHTKYVALKPFKPNENLLVEFWTTSGKEANNIKSGSALSVHKGFGIKQDSCWFLTTSDGGKDELNSQDKLNSSRRSLLSRDRIVTREDVKALCYELYGDKINRVEVKRGYKNDIDLKKGLMPCIDIIVTPNFQVIKEVSELSLINTDLHYLLKKNAINTMFYNIKVDHQKESANSFV